MIYLVILIIIMYDKLLTYLNASFFLELYFMNDDNKT